MTREETKKALGVMQAYIMGREIEVATSLGTYARIGDPSWDWGDNPNRYRVVPDRRTIMNIIRDLYEDERVVSSHYDGELHVTLYIDGAHFLSVLKNTFRDIDFSKAPKKPTFIELVHFICSQYRVN